MKKSKKISLFVPTLRGGGAERVMVNLAHGFVKRGLDIDLVVREQGTFIKDVPREVRLVDLHASRALTSLPGLIRYLRRERPFAMLSAMAHANIVAIIAAKIAAVDTRMVVSVHNTISYNLDFSSINGILQLGLIRKIYPYADTVIVVSEDAKLDFLNRTGLDPQKYQVIYNPVVTPELFEKARLPIDHHWFGQGMDPIIIGVGRLSKQKDFSTLIRAFALVREKKPAKLLIIGEGEEKNVLERLIKELNLSEHVDLHGFVENPYAYLSRADVFVLSSAWEGLPTVLIESLALGVPVVSTDCPSGPREILHNGEYGILAPVEDIAAIAQGIFKCLENAPLYKAPANAWERFDIDIVAEQYLKVLIK